MEAIEARLVGADASVYDLEYRGHVQNIGWQPWVRNGMTAGTSGQSLRVEAIRMHLTGQLRERYSVWYRAHVQNIGWLGWARDGEDSGSTSFGLRVEALQVRVLPNDSAGPSSSGSVTNVACVSPTTITYGAYVQDSGWQVNVSNGASAGTTGKSLRIEGLRASLGNGAGTDGGVQINAHVQDVGWQGWRSSGSDAGEPGSGRRIEAIQVRLTGSASTLYDVWYRVHVEGYGWMGWACNGASAGSIKVGKRIEAVQMRLVGKGGAAPGPTSFSFAGEVRRPHMVLVGDSRVWRMYQTLYGRPAMDLYTRDGNGDV